MFTAWGHKLFLCIVSLLCGSLCGTPLGCFASVMPEGRSPCYLCMTLWEWPLWWCLHVGSTLIVFVSWFRAPVPGRLQWCPVLLSQNNRSLSLLDQHSHCQFRLYTLCSNRRYQAIDQKNPKPYRQKHSCTHLYTYPLHWYSFMCKQIGTMMNKHQMRQWNIVKFACNKSVNNSPQDINAIGSL